MASRRLTSGNLKAASSRWPGHSRQISKLFCLSLPEIRHCSNSVPVQHFFRAPISRFDKRFGRFRGAQNGSNFVSILLVYLVSFFFWAILSPPFKQKKRWTLFFCNDFYDLPVVKLGLLLGWLMPCSSIIVTGGEKVWPPVAPLGL